MCFIAIFDYNIGISLNNLSITSHCIYQPISPSCTISVSLVPVLKAILNNLIFSGILKNTGLLKAIIMLMFFLTWSCRKELRNIYTVEVESNKLVSGMNKLIAIAATAFTEPVKLEG